MYNHVQLIGRMGNDPESKSTKDGMSIASFSIATSEKVKGEERTEWHRCKAFGKCAELIVSYTGKGSLVFVDGMLRTSKWKDKDGSEKQQTEVIVNTVKFLSKREGAQVAPSAAVQDDSFIDDAIPF